MIEKLEYLGKFEDFWKCSLYCLLYLLVIERCKKSLKTDYENLMHGYLLSHCEDNTKAKCTKLIGSFKILDG